MSRNVGVSDIASICEFILALSKSDGWIYSDTPATLNNPDWEVVPGLPTGANNLRFSGRVPLLVNDTWVSAGLLNSATHDGDAVAIYRDPDTGTIDLKTYTERYPSDETDGTPDSMPRAGIASNWGDFVVLGDIHWKADPSLAYSNTNTARYPHGLWFSEAGTTDTYNPDKVFFVGQKLERNAVLGLFPVERGLLVVTQSLVVLLRGTPDDFVYEELRSGISPSTSSEVTFWPYTGLVVWLDRTGKVWATNGDVVARLDEGVTIKRADAGMVLGLNQDLFVSGGVDVRLFHTFGEGGAWTTLDTPSGWQRAVFCRSTVIGVGANQDSGGTFILDSETNGILGQDFLFGTVDSVQVLTIDSNYDKRGTFNGVNIRPVMRTRPLPGASDRTVFWHRFGGRANGPGRLRKVVSYSSADIDERGYQHRVAQRLDDRKDFTFEAHGPSLEAVFELEFEGDVTPEHVTVAAHRGRLER
jgi:hypothetical protein